MLMDNQQLPPAPPPITPTGPSSAYDFLRDKPASKKSLLPSGGSKMQRIVLALVGLALLFVIGVIFMNILNAPGRAAANDLLLAAQQQEELIRLAGIGEKDATSPDTKNLAVNAKLTLQTDRLKLQAIVNKSKKLDERILAQGRDSSTDKTLAAAKQANRFDEVFTSTLKKELLKYQQTLKRVYDNSNNQTNKQVLAEQYSHVKLLLEALE